MDYQVTLPNLTMEALRILTNELPDAHFEAGPDDPYSDGSYTCRDPQSKNAVRLIYRRNDSLEVKISIVFVSTLIESEFQLDRSDLQKRDIDYFSQIFIKPACYAIADRIKKSKCAVTEPLYDVWQEAD